MTRSATHPEQITSTKTGSHPPQNGGAAVGIDRPARIAVLNDIVRRSLVGGPVFETPGMLALPAAERVALLPVVRRFAAFDGVNDPHKEASADDRSPARYSS